MVQSHGGYIQVGENYESNFLAVQPFGDIVDQNEATIKIKVSDEDVTIYHSVDYVHWKKVRGVDVVGTTATFKSSNGGIFVARKNGGQPTNIIVGVVVAVVVLILIGGTVLYCKRRGNGSLEESRTKLSE